jgi:hypothetical protein
VEPLIVRISPTYAVLVVAIAVIPAAAVAAIALDSWGRPGALVFATLGVIVAFGTAELFSRRYEFNCAVIRYRHLFSWHERTVPSALLFLDDAGAIEIRDGNTSEEVLRITREFTRGRSLVAQLAEYYLDCDREILVPGENEP